VVGLIVAGFAAACQKSVTPPPTSSAAPTQPIATPVAEPAPSAPAPGGMPPHPNASAQAKAIIKGYQDRITANPRDLDALIKLGNAMYDLHRDAEAEDLYRRALAIDTENPTVRTDLATVLHRQGKSKEAITELQRALAIDYKHETALLNLGLLKLKVNNDRAGAIATWKQLIDTTENKELAAKVQAMIAEVEAAPQKKSPAVKPVAPSTPATPPS